MLKLPNSISNLMDISYHKNICKAIYSYFKPIQH